MSDAIHCTGCGAQMVTCDIKCQYCGVSNQYYEQGVQSAYSGDAADSTVNALDSGDIAYAEAMRPKSKFETSGPVGKALIILSCAVAVSFLLISSVKTLALHTYYLTGNEASGGGKLILFILFAGPFATWRAVRAFIPEGSQWKRISILIWPLMQLLYLFILTNNIMPDK
jgi:hypothetical protein